MNSTWNRRTFLSGSGALLAAAATDGALAAGEKINLRFSDSTTADAPRSQALVQIFAKKIGDEFNFQPYFNSALYKQGTELVAVQRGNLEMANMPPSDFANQVPAFDILGAAYVVRDAAHLDRIFKSEVGDTFRKLAREKLDVVILAPAYYGVRHVNLKGRKKINTPQDLSGVKLRMPGGESWQFLGRSIGASPVTVAYSETYVALQTGVVDAQDNPLPNDKIMKFYEVTNQIVLTGHNVGFGLLVMGVKAFDALTADQQRRIVSAAQESFAWSTAEYIKQEQELLAFFKSAGLDVYTPDLKAFRTYAHQQYLQSPLSKSWPPGMLDKINAL